MQTEASQQIIKRFFEALYHIKGLGLIRGKQTFTAKFGINRWNFNSLEKDMSRDIFQSAWLTYLVEEYGVSAKWLLTGQGNIMAKQKNSRAEVEK